MGVLALDRPLGSVQQASVRLHSVQAYEDAFKPQALGHHTHQLTHQLRPPKNIFCQVLLSRKMHDAVILIMCIPNSSKDHISPSPSPIFLHQGLIRGPCMGKRPQGEREGGRAKKHFPHRQEEEAILSCLILKQVA